MGHSASKFVSNTAQYATELTTERDGREVESLHLWKSYDYVIIGGGTAGCVLASRISEDRNVTVLLVEAGGSHRGELFSRMPLPFGRLFKTPADWNYETVCVCPQPNLDNRTIYWPRGKLLGGSSSMNAMIYHRCSPEDFSVWEKVGAKGWSYKNLKGYFQKAERYLPHPEFPHDKIDTSAHGTSGPIVTSICESAHINNNIIESCLNVGIPHSNDFNTDKGTIGISHFVGTIDGRGERSSTATGYLTDEVLSRPNLTVAISTMVERIIFTTEEGGVPRAKGIIVSAERNGPRFGISAGKEVILSAGTVGTPQILMVSGLGPSKELKKHGIPVVQDLPLVGQSLQDHFCPGPVILRAKPGTTWDYLHNRMPGIAALLRWFIKGTGPMAGIGTQVALFVRSDSKELPIHDNSIKSPVRDLTSGPGSPDIEMVIAPFIVINNGWTKTPGRSGLTAASVLLKPASYGTITLASSSVYDHPIIDPKFLDDSNDVALMIKAIRLTLHIARTKPLADSLDLPDPSDDDNGLFWPGNRDPEGIPDEEIAAWIRKHGQSPWHPTSSAKIGDKLSNSVVDPTLRVHGVKGLRIVDASVFPTQVSGHPCAVVVAIAERASDMISGKI